MKILDQEQIKQKTKRLAIEILENNTEAKGLVIAGINNNGMAFAQLILEELLQLTEQDITLTRIRLNPAAPDVGQILLEMPLEQLHGKAVILVDDVANTGRTLFYATRPLMEGMPEKIEVAVLVDRTHKSFPIRVDYVGLSLATTLKEHISVVLHETEELAAHLN